MPSAPNLNPFASSAAVEAAVHRHPLLAGATPGGKTPDSERKRERVTCGTARSEAEFHEPLNRGLELGLIRELGEQDGLMGAAASLAREIPPQEEER